MKGDDLLRQAKPFVGAWPDLQLECLPNRNSLLYEKTYGIDGAATIFRGTLRYEGFSMLMHTFKEIGLFKVESVGAENWANLLFELQRAKAFDGSLEDFLLQCAGGDEELAIRAQECLQWLGMTGDSEIPASSAVIDLFCAKLEENLQYGKDEHDMVAMHHSITALFPDGCKEEHQSALQVFGDDSMSAMCRTVGYPTAAATELILSGAMKGTSGLLLPTTKNIYEPILKAMESEGIVFEESVRVSKN